MDGKEILIRPRLTWPPKFWSQHRLERKTCPIDWATQNHHQVKGMRHLQWAQLSSCQYCRSSHQVNSVCIGLMDQQLACHICHIWHHQYPGHADRNEAMLLLPLPPLIWIVLPHSLIWGKIHRGLHAWYPSPTTYYELSRRTLITKPPHWIPYYAL